MTQETDNLNDSIFINFSPSYQSNQHSIFDSFIEPSVEFMKKDLTFTYGQIKDIIDNPICPKKDNNNVIQNDIQSIINEEVIDINQVEKDILKFKINKNDQNKIILDIKGKGLTIPINKKTSDINEMCDSTNLNSNKVFIEKQKNKKNKKNKKKKVKKIVFNTLIKYINSIIRKVYGGKIGEGLINKKIIRNINPSEKEKITIAHNKQLLNKTLKEILSAEKISGRYTSVLIPNMNAKIINDLLNEENEEKRKIFIDLFSMKFSDWILMLSDPKGELKDLYEEELSKKNKRCKNEINELSHMIKNFEKEFLNEKN